MAPWLCLLACDRTPSESATLDPSLAPQAADNDGAPDGPEDGQDGGNFAAGTPEASPSHGRWAVVEAAGKSATLTAPARVSAEANSRADVTAVVRGQVEQTLVRVGQSVNADDVVVTLRSPELLLAASQAQRLRSQVIAHRARLDELSRLEAEGLSRRETLFALEAKIAELETQADAAASLLTATDLSRADIAELKRSGSLPLRAKTSGVVLALHATPGAMYEPYGSPPLVEIIGEGGSWIAADLTRTPPTAVDATFVGIDGRRIALADPPRNQVALPSGGVRVYYAPAEEISLPPDLAGRVHFKARARQAFALPRTALLSTTDGAQVVVNVAGQEKSVPVTVHAQNNTTVIVSGALQVGQRVALEPRLDSTMDDGQDSAP